MGLRGRPLTLCICPALRGQLGAASGAGTATAGVPAQGNDWLVFMDV